MDVICVVHAIFLAWRKEGDTLARIPASPSVPLPSLCLCWGWGTSLAHSCHLLSHPNQSLGVGKTHHPRFWYGINWPMVMACHTVAYQQLVPSR